MPAQGKRRAMSQRLGAGGLRYFEFKAYKSNSILLSFPAAKGGQNCLYFFVPEVYMEKAKRLKRVMSSNMAVDSTVRK